MTRSVNVLLFQHKFRIKLNILIIGENSFVMTTENYSCYRMQIKYSKCVLCLWENYCPLLFGCCILRAFVFIFTLIFGQIITIHSCLRVGVLILWSSLYFGFINNIFITTFFVSHLQKMTIHSTTSSLMSK